MKKVFILICFCGFNLIVSAQTKALPQLGKSPIKDVIGALTLDEKVKICVGMGFHIDGVPAGMLPPSDPEDDKIPAKVKGASGRLHGIERLNIPSLTVTDGPAGVNFLTDFSGTRTATAIPNGTLIASSWDTALQRKVGGIIGIEAKEYGIDIILAPALNIHRNPLGGRNFEYYSEDPLLSGSTAAAMANGIQSKNVGVSFKHFAANNSESNRMTLNTIVSERALREIYLRNFEYAVKKGNPWTVMSSYNLINGTYTSETYGLLTTILRKEWGFKGFVMSDWFGGKEAGAQIKAGNDLLMPGNLQQRDAIKKAIADGKLSVEQLDLCVRRILRIVLRSNTFKKYPYSNNPPLKQNAALSRKAATEGMVLLKNEGNTLPLSKSSSLALFGNASYDIIAGGTGSGDVKRAYTISFVDGAKNAGYKLNESIASTYQEYIKADKAKQPAPSMMSLFMPHLTKEMAVESELITKSAETSDVVILTIGRNAGEGADRKVENDFNLSEAEMTTLKTISSAYHAKNKKVVVVINAGGVIEVASWRDYADAILLAWQPGMEGGNAIADVISGAVNPSGKLTTTFPMSYDDVPSAKTFPGKELQARPAGVPINPMSGVPSEISYDDDVFVGYRHYATNNVKTAYEFGYGLSYTTFSYSDLKLSAPNFDKSITATVTVKNTGKVAGKEIVELYLSAPAKNLQKPSEELKSYAKTNLLKPNQSQTITFKLHASDLASWNTKSGGWVAEAGTYTVKVGASSLNIKQTKEFKLGAELKLK